jgi:glyoxylase-like metal-dependent hydrolase (beta-lactamase superfamily II)
MSTPIPVRPPTTTPTVQIGEWRIDILNGGRFVMDGGILFGVVPRRLWAMARTPDSLNRLPCACNCLLARNGRQTILIDTGYGGKQSPLDRKFYLLEQGEPLLAALQACGVATGDIDLVVLSHLHWDHVGGVSRYNERGELTLTFPRAVHLVGSIDWQDATSGVPELAGTYDEKNLGPLRDLADLQLIEHDHEIAPGLRAILTGGHTRGHLALRFDSQGHTGLYFSDLCPSTYHLHPFWSLAYDLYPLDTRREKARLLAEAADGDWIVFWTHDPQIGAARLARHAKRAFMVTETWAAP